jgi:hypothetical protein
MLPVRKGYKDDYEDGWGQKLNLEKVDDNTCVLESLGADSKNGGSGENEDIQLVVKVSEREGKVKVTRVLRSWE